MLLNSSHTVMARGANRAGVVPPKVGPEHLPMAVRVAGIEPAASSFQARSSTSDLHPDESGLRCEIRTRVSRVKSGDPWLLDEAERRRTVLASGGYGL